MVNVFNFRIFSAEAAPGVCPGCRCKVSRAEGHPGAMVTCRGCCGGTYVISVWDLCVCVCVCVGVTLLHGAGIAEPRGEPGSLDGAMLSCAAGQLQGQLWDLQG